MRGEEPSVGTRARGARSPVRGLEPVGTGAWRPFSVRTGAGAEAAAHLGRRPPVYRPWWGLGKEPVRGEGCMVREGQRVPKAKAVQCWRPDEIRTSQGVPKD